MVGSLGRLYGEEVVAQIGGDYCAAADRGGNVEPGLSREEGVSFNPRIARIVSLVMQDCEEVTPHMLRVAVFSTLPDGATEGVPTELCKDVSEVRAASPESSPWIQGISLALYLDRIRHLHMVAMSDAERIAYVEYVKSSPLLSVRSGAPENLRLKVIHAIDLQSRRIAIDAEK